MWDIAGEFQAMLVFAEHRYYGKSLPFGKLSYKVSFTDYLPLFVLALQYEQKNFFFSSKTGAFKNTLPHEVQSNRPIFVLRSYKRQQNTNSLLNLVPRSHSCL